jgi:hypothetical protein
VFGQSGVSFTATVTDSSSGSSGTPSGTVQFQTNGVNFGSAVSLSSGSGTSGALPTALPPGSVSVTAIYNGDANFNTSTSGTLSQTVNKANSGTAIVSVSNPSVYGQGSVTFTATVTNNSSGSTGKPSGTVQFQTNGVNFGSSAPLSGISFNVSSGALPTTLPAGSYSVTAIYNGDANFNTSTSGTLTQTINKASPTVTFNSSENPSGYRDSVSFVAGLPTNATGNVVFTSTNGPISTNALTSGSAASLSVTNLPRGTNSVTLQYAGDSNYLAFTNLLADGQIVTNHAPVITGSVTFTRSANTIKIFTSDLVTNATDMDGDTLTVTSTGVSTNGITLQTAPGIMLYVNTNGVNDAFTYTLSDGYGGSATGTNYVNFTPFATGQSGNVTVGGGVANLVFYGIPTYRYGVQRSTNMTDWTIILITNAPTGGAFHYTDNFSDLGAPPASAYYRLIWNP